MGRLLKSKLVVGIVALVIVGGAVVAVQRRSASKPASASYPLYEVKRGKLEIAVTGSGNISALDRVSTRAKVAGTVAKILVNEGDQVEAGQPMIVLDNQDVVDAYRQATLELEAAQLRYNDLAKAPGDPELKAAEAKLVQAREAVKQKQEDADNLQVKSPIAGALSQFKLSVGDDVAPGQQVAVVIDESVIKFNAAVYQADVKKIEVGKRATVVIGSDLAWSSDKSYTGTISAVAREGSGTGKNATFNVTIDIPNVDGQLRAGMTGYVQSIEMGDETVIWPTITGTTSANQRKAIVSETGGKVKEVLVREGQNVAPGQVLLVLENGSVMAALEQAEAELKLAQKEWDDLLSRKTVGTSSDVSQQAIKLEQARLAYEQSKRDMDELTIKAPISGTVSAISVKVGDRVSQNQEVGAVSNLSKLKLVVPVDELDVGKLKVGMPAEVTSQALPGKKFKATVSKIAVEGTVKEGVASYDVTLELEDSARAGGLVPGMSADGRIVADSRDGVISIPAEALRTRGGNRYVYILKDGKPEAVNVTVGLASETAVEITSGLKEGDKVILSNPENNRTFTPFMGGMQGQPARVQPNTGGRNR